MNINIKLTCPHCHSTSIVRNGKKRKETQNYLCKDCRRQFIADHERTYPGTCSWVPGMVKLMLVNGMSIRGIAAVLSISLNNVLHVLAQTEYTLKPHRKHYGTLEIDEFWTYIGSNENKLWLIYAYHRKSGEIVAYVWGKRDLSTAQRLRNRLRRLGVRYGAVATDDWNSFLSVFKQDKHKIGKKHTVGIEGNNCRLRHRVKRAFRKTCCFSKSLLNHKKAFDMAFHYINKGTL